MGRHPFGTEALCPFKGINGRLSIHLYVSKVVVTKDYFNMSLLHVQWSYDKTLKTRVQLECVSWYITNVPIVIHAYIVQSTDDRYKSFECSPPNIYDVNELVEAGFLCTNHSVPTIKCTACELLFNPTSLQGATPYQFHLDKSPNCEFFQENGLQNEHHTNTRDDDSFASDQRTSRSLPPRRTNVREGLEETDNVNNNYTTNGMKTKLKRENDKKGDIPNGALSLETTGDDVASYSIENTLPTEIHGARPRDGTESNTTHFPQQRFVTKESRIASFQHRMWPKENVHQSPKELAEAGFYYTGAEDIVRCFHCDIGLAEWHPDDDPWVEHARHSPECPYVRDQKGQDFINNIQTQWARIYTPKHPEYSQINVRRRSYENAGWPRDNVLQTPEQLSAAGFFYTGLSGSSTATGSANLTSGKRLTNHSARKYLVQKLNDNGLPPNQIMQISGHRNIQSINNYSTINTIQHKAISDVISSNAAPKETSTQALVPPRSSPSLTSSQIITPPVVSNQTSSVRVMGQPSLISGPVHGGTINIKVVHNHYVCRKRPMVVYSDSDTD